MSTAPGPTAYGVVVPVKPVAVAKSRLAPLGDEVRRGLVTAFVLDTVQETRACARVVAVLAVTNDTTVSRRLADRGIGSVPDVVGDLNAAVSAGVDELLRRHPTVRPVALCGDLPAMRSDALEVALDAAATVGAAFVADLADVGTTLYTAPSAALFRPRFGPGSRAAHLADGAVDLAAAPGVPESLRLDVDTPSDLAAALEIGVGEQTQRVISRHGLGRDEGIRPARTDPLAGS